MVLSLVTQFVYVVITDRFRVGQNLAISMSSVAGSASSSWATAINGTMNGKWVGWFSEVQAMKSGYVNGGW